MRLPTFAKGGSTQKETFCFKGIDPNNTNADFLYDAINLTGFYKCRSRAARSPAAFTNNPPDQIIKCSNKLYFRYGNTLSEVTCDEKGILSIGEKTYSLSSIDPAPDRSLFYKNNCLCVLPDGIQLSDEAEEWYTFGTSCDIATALPFTNSKTLFYTSGYSGGDVCDEAYLFNVGDKVTFSWLSDKTFTVTAVDTAFTIMNEIQINEGVRITLNATVSKWNSLPNNAVMKLSTPKNRKLLDAVKLGVNETVNFTGNHIAYYDKSGDYYYEYSLLKTLYKGQRVKISGSKKSANNKTVTITEIGDSFISFDEKFLPSTETSVITITPVMPSFDFITEADDRIIGVDNNAKTFWVSRSGAPFIFHQFPSKAGDSWCFKYVDEVTGLTIFKDSVIAFTENGGFRLFGSNALNFGITQLHISGMKKNCFKTFASISDDMFYQSELGVVKFGGSTDSIITSPLPDRFVSTCGEAYKGNYYLLTDGRLWVYNTEKNVWWSENAENILEIFSFFGKLYFVTQSTIYLAEGTDSSIDWMLETCELPFKPDFYLKPLNLILNATSQNGCIVKIYMKTQENTFWCELDALSLKGGSALKIPLLKSPCNSFKIKINGSGDICIDNIQIEYRRM